MASTWKNQDSNLSLYQTPNSRLLTALLYLFFPIKKFPEKTPQSKTCFKYVKKYMYFYLNDNPKNRYKHILDRQAVQL